MKPLEIRQMSEKELTERIRSEEEMLAQLKFRLATHQLESPIKVRVVRRDIARMKTILRERQRAQQNKK
ncbi:MAG: 50S ribosomal protein L29 [Ignavibacteria bacterium]|nr:50S ribosomal protein L29 [Ignavibacteria bacterium]